MDHNTLMWMLTPNHPNGRLMRWRLPLSEFENEVLYLPGLAHQVLNALSRMPHSLNTHDFQATDDSYPTFWVQLGRFGAAAKGERGSRNHILDDSFDTINAPTRSHTATHTPANDIPDNKFNANDWVIEDREPQALDDFAVPLSTIKLMEDQKFDYFRQLFLAFKASDPNSDSYEDNSERLLRRYPSLSELQKIVIQHSHRGRQYAMAHHRKLAGDTGTQECMPPYSRPTIGHSWQLVSPWLFKIACNLQTFVPTCASKPGF